VKSLFERKARNIRIIKGNTTQQRNMLHWRASRLEGLRLVLASASPRRRQILSELVLNLLRKQADDQSKAYTLSGIECRGAGVTI
jgi:hypothetical protein